MLSAMSLIATCRVEFPNKFCRIVSTISILCALIFVTSSYSDDIRPEHMRFGSGLQAEPIDDVHGFPLPRDFFDNYVLQSKPLKMSGAARHSPAFVKWTDSYFLGITVPADNSMLVETKKKEDRKQPTLDMNFKDFVRIYNNTDQYMVNPVPEFLHNDIVIPGPIQCEDIYLDGIVQAMMWYSSGGTKSVVHTDSVENINCLYSGRKEFVMVNPHLYGHLVDLDHPEGAYSGIDVDRVDLNKYPGLSEVRYQHVTLEAGDCLYIPHLWIHQVRSYGRNIAVNVWWKHKINERVDLNLCTTELDPNLTLTQVNINGFEDQDLDALRDHFVEIFSAKESLNMDDMINLLLHDRDKIEQMNPGVGYTLPLKAIFDIIDENSDQTGTISEVENLGHEKWMEIQEELEKTEVILSELERVWMDREGLSEERRDEL